MLSVKVVLVLSVALSLFVSIGFVSGLLIPAISLHFSHCGTFVTCFSWIFLFFPSLDRVAALSRR